MAVTPRTLSPFSATCALSASPAGPQPTMHTSTVVLRSCADRYVATFFWFSSALDAYTESEVGWCTMLCALLMLSLALKGMGLHFCHRWYEHRVSVGSCLSQYVVCV